MTPPRINLFGLVATHRIGRNTDRFGATYEVTLAQTTYVATDYGDAWKVGIHGGALLECWATGEGDTLADAEAECERYLRREGRKRSETADEIAERRRRAA